MINSQNLINNQKITRSFIIGVADAVGFDADGGVGLGQARRVVNVARALVGAFFHHVQAEKLLLIKKKKIFY